MNTEANTFWLNFKNYFLKQNENNQIYRSWLEPIVPSKIEQKSSNLYLTLQAPSDLHKKWLQENVLENFYNHIHQFYKGICQIQIEVTPHLPFQIKSQAEKNTKFQNQKVFFNPNYTFKNFIVGKKQQSSLRGQQGYYKIQ